jgi:hypothetical protein
VTVGHDTDSIDAAMQPGGSISGTVTAAAGGALGGVCVAAIIPPDEFITGGSTDADGTYTIRGLAVGDYIVGFSTGCGYPGDLVDQWFDHQSTPETATLVSVTAGHTTGSIDAAMYPPGAPGVPTAVTATAGSGKALVAWTAPVVTGDGITGYDVRYRPVGAGSWTTSSTTGTPTHAIISSLANGTQYEFQVRAVSTSAGTWTGSVTATPTALAVTITSASGGKNTITVAFTVTGGTWFDSTGAAVAHTQTCAVGSAPAVACTSPANFDLVPGGLQSVTVTTTDADGTHASATTTGVKVTGSKNPKPPRH